MDRLILVSAVVITFVAVQPLCAQTDSTPTDIVSVQPMLWLDNLVPTELIGFSGQYEHTVSDNHSLVARLLWFRDPLFNDYVASSEGYGISTEYRLYLSTRTQGWHIAPFAEIARFKYIGGSQIFYGSGTKTIFDFGVLVGHKWVSNRLSFDISFRTAWYGPATYPKGRFFPSGNRQLNSHMLISLGYGI